MKYTPQQVAEEIDKIKPDLSKFIKDLDKSDKDLVSHFNNETNKFVKALICELAITQSRTNRSCYIYDSDTYTNYLNEFMNYNRYGNNIFSYYFYALDNNYDLKDNHILKYVSDNKPYLTRYLKSKIYDPVKQSDVLVIKEDEFSFTLFKRNVEKLPKGLTSIQVEAYVKVLETFKTQEYKQKYLEVLFDNCAKPTIKLQKAVCKSYKISFANVLSKSKQKYMTFHRYEIRQLADSLSLPMHWTIREDQDSQYKPFITGLPVNPKLNKYEFQALFYTSLILNVKYKQEPTESIKYMIDKLNRHITDKAFKDFLKEELLVIKSYQNATVEFLTQLDIKD